MNSRKTIAIFLLFSTLASNAISKTFQPTLLGKTLGYMSQSKPIYLFEKYINPSWEFLSGIAFLGNELACAEYQELGKEAQFALGIPEEQHVPIMKFQENHPFAQMFGGLATSNKIYINEKKLNQASYGYKRASLYHESVHKKYNDPGTAGIINLSCYLAAGYLTHKLIQQIKTPGTHKGWHCFGVIAASEIVSTIACLPYLHFIERRADTEAFYALRCYTCLHECAAHRHQRFEIEKNPLRNNGYLWAKDIELIAQEIEAQGLLCAHHAELLHTA